MCPLLTRPLCNAALSRLELGVNRLCLAFLCERAWTSRQQQAQHEEQHGLCGRHGLLACGGETPVWLTAVMRSRARRAALCVRERSRRREEGDNRNCMFPVYQLDVLEMEITKHCTSSTRRASNVQPSHHYLPKEIALSCPNITLQYEEARS